MKNLKTLAILLSALPCVALAQSDRFFGQGISDACYQSANHAYAQRKAQGMVDLQAQKLYQADLAACSGANPVLAAYAGTVNVDFFRFAEAMVKGQITPTLYVGLVRDRSRKLRTAMKSRPWMDAFARTGDSDGDLVPDSIDKCPNTPDFTRTDDSGCADPNPPAPQPAFEQVKDAMNGIGLLTSPACDGAAVPGISEPLKAGYDTNNRITFAIAATPIAGQPASCVTLYEVQVWMSQPTAAAPSPTNMEQIVFRSTEDTDLANPARLVFRVNAADTGSRLDLYNIARYYNRVELRVRAINGNGLSGGWSARIVSTGPSFGEP